MKISAVLDVVTPLSAGFAARRIAASSPSTLKGVKGKTLVCVEGSLWVTQEGDREDHILRAGERFPLTAKGRVVVSALRPGSYILD
jgi:hypothetical protein